MSAIAMRIRKKNGNPSKPPVGSSPAAPRKPFLGQVYFFSVLLLISLLGGLSLDPVGKIYVAGEIAGQDISADQDLLVEDRDATAAKRQQVASSQPPVFDLIDEPVRLLEKNVKDILAAVKKTAPEDVEQVRWQISEVMNAEVRRETFSIWRDDEFQKQILDAVIPWLRDYFGRGVVAETRFVSQYRTGIIVRDVASSVERLKLEVQDLRDIVRLKDDLDELLKRSLRENVRMRKATLMLLEPFMQPSLVMDSELTQVRKNEIISSMEPVYRQIKKGEIIVRQGERVSLDQQIRLQSLLSQRPQLFLMYRAAGILLVALLFFYGLVHSRDKKSRPPTQKDFVLMGTMFLLFACMAKFTAAVRVPLSQGIVLVNIPPDAIPYCLPVAGATGVMALFFPATACFFSGLMLSFICAQTTGGGIGLFAYYFLGGLLNVVLVKCTETRADLLRSVLPLSASLLLAYAGVNLMDYHGVASFGAGLPFVIGSCLFSLLFTLAFSPIAEMLLGYTSRFKLMELMNLEQPLLQELMVSAPGTYHHSLIVSNMVEAGARAIGANPLLAKVAGLYHDIGKLKSPQYFIENQFTRENKHNKLTPSMSALILISHVKKGVELAKAHNIGPEITDIIIQHHGTSLISFFYHKALELAEGKGEVPREADYRYPGPKPQTKEAGLILLADVIEASGRTLVDPTPSRIKGHIEKMIRKIFTDGELDESELTLKDLNLVSETFLRILTGIFHHRIEYPGSRPEPQPEAKIVEPKTGEQKSGEAKPASEFVPKPAA